MSSLRRCPYFRGSFTHDYVTGNVCSGGVLILGVVLQFLLMGMHRVEVSLFQG